MKIFRMPVWMVVSMLGLQACMQPATTNQEEEVIDPCVATPSLCTTGELEPGQYNLAEFAKVSANAAVSDHFLAQNVRDGIARVNAEYTSWFPPVGIVNQSWVRFEWTTPVEIDVVGIYDQGSPDSLVTAGEVRFFSDDESEYIPSVDFALEASQTRGLYQASDGVSDMGEWVSGPGSGQKIVAMEVRIQNHTATNKIFGYNDIAGLNEVVIGGHRIEDESTDVANTVNLMPYARVVSASSVKDVQSHLAGPYSARKANDGSTATEWVTSAGGSNASISLEFDLPYCVQKIVLKDRSDSNHRFEHAKIVFNDANVVTDASTGAKPSGSSSLTVIVPTDFREDVEKISIMLDDVTGADSGLSEIEAYACDPS